MLGLLLYFLVGPMSFGAEVMRSSIATQTDSVFGPYRDASIDAKMIGSEVPDVKVVSTVNKDQEVSLREFIGLGQVLVFVMPTVTNIISNDFQMTSIKEALHQIKDVRVVLLTPDDVNALSVYLLSHQLKKVVGLSDPFRSASSALNLLVSDNVLQDGPIRAVLLFHYGKLVGMDIEENSMETACLHSNGLAALRLLEQNQARIDEEIQSGMQHKSDI